MATTFEEGFHAARSGGTPDDAPEEGVFERDEWLEGFDAGLTAGPPEFGPSWGEPPYLDSNFAD